MRYFLTWMRLRFARRQSELETDTRAACDRAAEREERWYPTRQSVTPRRTIAGLGCCASFLMIIAACICVGGNLRALLAGWHVRMLTSPNFYLLALASFGAIAIPFAATIWSANSLIDGREESGTSPLGVAGGSAVLALLLLGISQMCFSAGLS